MEQLVCCLITTFVIVIGIIAQRYEVEKTIAFLRSLRDQSNKPEDATP